MQKILVVEDNNLLNTTIAYNLQAEGYAVMQAKSLAEARRHLAQHPDLIVLDVNLPDGDGFSFCKEVKEKADIPVFFLTANDMESDMLKGYELGADDYITKPFSMVVFQKKIAAFLKRMQKQANPCWNDGHLFLDFSRQKASLDGKTLELTAFEFIILPCMCR